MKIVATIGPADVAARQLRYRVRCLNPTCWLADPVTKLNWSASLRFAQSYAEAHVENDRHAVVIEDSLE